MYTTACIQARKQVEIDLKSFHIRIYTDFDKNEIRHYALFGILFTSFQVLTLCLERK